MLAHAKPLLLVVLVSFAVAAVSSRTSAGVSFPDKPPSDSFHVDGAGLIGPEEGKEINRVAQGLWAGDQVPIVVVTIPSLASHGAAGWTIERYAYALFNEWGIGSERRNYGMLLLVSRDDRRARIELGAAWGHAQNYQAQEVMSTLIIPDFARGDYGAGILAGVRGMEAMARGLQLPKPKAPWWVLPATVAFFALCVWVIYSLFKSGRKGWGWALIIGLAALLFFALRMAARSGGSGGAFGGGSSGGGGASGSW